MTSVIVRKMKVEDIDNVRNIDSVAWQELTRKLYPDLPKITPRTEMGILAYLHANPDGAVVAVDEHAGVIGSSFSHVWGKTGWVGPLTVLPSYQGIGVGKELLKHSLRHLEDRGCSDIGLETMPEQSENMGMYLKLGLRPEGLVIIMGKSLENHRPSEPPEAVSFERLSERPSAERHLLASVRHVSDALSPGLDYTSEVELTRKSSLGDTIFARHGREYCGFCTVHTVMRREGMCGAAVRCIGILPGRGNVVLDPMLASAEDLAAQAELPELMVPIPGNRRRAIDAALSRGYRVVQTLERMMWMGSSGITSGTGDNLSSWSG
ncbi:MAG: GNAT family N-acetyltransferase [Methanobacteriota archaeon]|nr:MAG: GNAT family N-acetyltransferase [Euryarchaeota archaeon]